MALYTQAAVEAKLSTIQSDINRIENLCAVGGSIDRTVSKQVEILKNREKAFLRAFKCKTFEELNRKLEELRAAEPLIKNLSGEALSRTFLNSARKYMYQTGTLGGKDLKLEKLKQDFIRNVINDLNNAGNTLALPKINSTVQQLVFSLLHDLGSGVSLRSSSGLGGSIKYGGGNIEEVLEQIVISELTPTARARIAEFNSKHANSYELTSTANPIVISSRQSNLASITQNMLETEVRRKIENNEMTEFEFQQIQSDVINYILERGPRDSEFQQVVREIIVNAKYHIFFGKNLINGYTGLLGEIQAAYYLRKLGIQSGRKSKAEWTGGNRDAGWEPFEDIKMMAGRSQRGIQVKNTASDILSSINFADNKIENLNFSSLGIPGIEGIVSSLTAIYEIYNFNIEVNINEETGRWEARSNDKFAPTRARIEMLCHEANRAIAALAASMMRMSVGAKSSEGNVAYLVGGNKFVSASSTLSQILGEINSGNLNRIQVTSYFSKKGAGAGTIADYYNSNNKNTIPYGIKIRSAYQFD